MFAIYVIKQWSFDVRYVQAIQYYDFIIKSQFTLWLNILYVFKIIYLNFKYIIWYFLPTNILYDIILDQITFLTNFFKI